MTKLTWTLITVAAVALVATLMTARAMPPAEKVLICHIPQGNESNVQEIDINSNELDTHLAHGDFIITDDNQCVPQSPSSRSRR